MKDDPHQTSKTNPGKNDSDVLLSSQIVGDCTSTLSALTVRFLYNTASTLSERFLGLTWLQLNLINLGKEFIQLSLNKGIHHVSQLLSLPLLTLLSLLWLLLFSRQIFHVIIYYYLEAYKLRETFIEISSLKQGKRYINRNDQYFLLLKRTLGL